MTIYCWESVQVSANDHRGISIEIELTGFGTDSLCWRAMPCSAFTGGMRYRR